MPATLTGLAAALGGLVAGVVAGKAGSIPLAPAVGVAGGAALGLFLRRKPALKIMCFVVFSFVLGSVAASARLQRPTAIQFLAASVPSCELRATVLEQTGGHGTLVSVERASCQGYEPVRFPGVVSLDGAAGHAGSKILVRGMLLPLEDDSFSTQEALLGATARLVRYSILGRARARGSHAVAVRIREGLRGATEELGRAGALVRGLVTGDVAGIDDATMERFRSAGLAHLVAVSGSNVAIVVGTVILAARRLGHRLRVALCGLALALFVLVVGPEPSVLRAAAMGSISLLALVWGRRVEPLHGLCLAALIVIALRPALVFSVGLHLSAAATLGIVLWAAPFARRLDRLPDTAAMALAVTLAAQLAVAPILMLVFGEVSLAGLLANALAAPAVAPATLLGVGAGVLGAFNLELGGLCARAAAPFASWILGVADRLGGTAWASVEVPGAAGWAAVVVVGVAATFSIRRAFVAPSDWPPVTIE